MLLLIHKNAMRMCHDIAKHSLNENINELKIIFFNFHITHASLHYIKKILHSAFSTLLIFHTLHFPHSAFTTDSVYSTLLIFHTPHFPRSLFSTLLISALHTPQLRSQWRDVLSDPYVFEARPSYFVFL